MVNSIKMVAGSAGHILGILVAALPRRVSYAHNLQGRRHEFEAQGFGMCRGGGQYSKNSKI